MITVENFFTFYFDENDEFSKTLVFCSEFPSGSDEAKSRVQWSSWAILAILAIFVKSKKRTPAPSQTVELLYQSLKISP